MNIYYEFTSSDIFYPFFDDARGMIYEDNFDFNIWELMSDIEKKNSKELNKAFKDTKDYYLFAKDGDKHIGWSFGVQKSNQDFYMINSAVFPEYRNKGIYTEMMVQAVKHISKMGFQHIYSRHKMSNNAILIPKLKFGFLISGFEINDMFGPLVQLSYYTNPKRRELLEIRMGMKKPSDKYLKLIQ